MSSCYPPHEPYTWPPSYAEFHQNEGGNSGDDNPSLNYPAEWHRHRCNDTEWAWKTHPCGECPDPYNPSGDERECVTSGDVDRWNEAYDWVSANSGMSMNSADLWNSNYETVNERSAYWESAYSGLPAQNAMDMWNSAYSAVLDASALLDNYGDVSSLYSNNGISGDGSTKKKAFGLERELYAKINDSYTLVRQLIGELYRVQSGSLVPTITSAYQKWLPIEFMEEEWKPWKAQVSHSAGIFEDQIELIWAALVGMSGGVYNLVYHAGDNIDIDDDRRIISGRNWTPEIDKAKDDVSAYATEVKNSLSAYIRDHEGEWKNEFKLQYAPDMTVENVSQYNAAGVIYYKPEQ